MTENEMVGWHRQFNGHEFEQTSGDSEGQGSLTCCRPWVAESDTNERLNNNKNKTDFLNIEPLDLFNGREEIKR